MLLPFVTIHLLRLTLSILLCLYVKLYKILAQLKATFSLHRRVPVPNKMRNISVVLPVFSFLNVLNPTEQPHHWDLLIFYFQIAIKFKFLFNNKLRYTFTLLCISHAWTFFFFFFKFTSVYTLETGQQGFPSELSLCFSAFLKHLEISIRYLVII